MLTLENIQTIVEKAKLDGSQRILEIGCGSGEMTHLLASELGCVITAIDKDVSLIQYAKTAYPRCTNYVVADALSLPFEDSAFDVVISHTFFTSIFDAERAMSEMQRVCVEHGKIISITAETFLHIPHSVSMPNTSWYEEYKCLRGKVDILFKDEAQKVSNGVKPELIPEFFADSGLDNIAVYQLGKFFSLSNAAVSESERKELIKAEYDAEITRSTLLNGIERTRYIELLGMRMADLLDFGDSTWSWSGGSNLLVVAANTKKGVIPVSEYQELQVIEAKIKDICIRNSGMRANCKSVASVSLSSASTSVNAVGWTPLKATVQAYKKLLSEENPAQVTMLGLNQLTKLLDDEDSLLNVTLEIMDIDSAKEKKNLVSVLMGTGKEIPCSEYKRISDNTYHFLPTAITEWCFCSESVVCESTRSDAIEKSLFNIVAQCALSKFMHRELPLHEISVADINSCRAECVMQKIRSQGYSIRCWSALFANAIPVIFACISSEHGSLIKVTADYSIGSALESCILAFFENRQLENLIKRGRKKYIQEPYTDEDFYNFIKTGENIFPCGFFDSINKTAGAKAPPVSIGNDCVSLLKLLKSQNIDVYISEQTIGDYVAVRILAPCKHTLWPFAKKRLIEYQLHQQVKSIVSNIDLWGNDQIEYAMEYISRKCGWCQENTYAFFAGIKKDGFLFGEKIDAKILLATYYIKNRKYTTASSLLPSTNAQFRCLRCALEQGDRRILADNYTKAEIEKAFEFLSDPYKALNDNTDFYDKQRTHHTIY